jgi:ribulose-phosphate 3-epimerase
MFEIVPTIQTASFEDYSEKIKKLVGICPRVSVDIVDGKFAPEQTLSLETLKDEETQLRLDLHLMVKEPEEWVDRALQVLPDRLIAQIEMMHDKERFINEATNGGVEVGIALDLETPVSVVAEEIYHLVDQVLVLAAKAGYSGQDFDRQVLKKIAEVRQIVGNLVDVGVDCGLDEKTIPLCREAGANIFYVNSAFWSASDLAQRYQELTDLINK